jgi:hypothetical protein
MLHRLVELVVFLAVLAGIGLGTLAWRLSQGPLDLPWLTRRVEKSLNRDETVGHIAIAGAALAWEGFRLGVDRPLDIKLRDVTFANQVGRQVLAVPNAEISLSLHALLLGQIVPRALEIDQPRIALVRAADGSIGAGTGAEAAEPAEADTGSATPLLAILTELAHPPANDRSRSHTGALSQLLRLRIRDASVQVVDHQLGMTWWVPTADLDLARQPRGGVDGTAEATLALGSQQARIAASVVLPADKGPVRLRLRLSPIEPAAIARLIQKAAPLSAIAAPVGGEADLTLDDAMRLQAAHLSLQAGTGILNIANGLMPITRAVLVADITPGHAALHTLRLELPGSPGGAPSVLQATGVVIREPDRYDATLGLTLDHVAFADLPRLWPLGVGHGARAWITENITAGTARDGHVEVGLQATPDLSDVTLTRATGSLLGEGLRVTWLAPVPPIVDGTAVLNIIDPDTLEIVVQSGRQQLDPAMTPAPPPGDNGLMIRGGRMRITGIMQPHQVGAIEADIAGSVPDAVALLSEPRLHLLSKHPLPLNDPTGEVTAHLTMGIPLEASVSMDDIVLHAKAHLEDVHLGGVVLGHDLDRGKLDLDATADGMSITGQATLAGIPANLTAAMDFRAGAPSQVLQRISVTGRATTRQLAAVGVDAGPMLDGTLGLTANLSERRDGAGEVALAADLTSTVLAVAPLGWRKPAGQAAKASARVVLSHDRLMEIDDISIDSADLSAAGSVTCVDGKPAVIQISQVTLGRSQARATIRLPIDNADTPSGRVGAGSPIAISVTGSSLDLSGHFTHQPPRPGPKRKPEEPSGPHWTLDARFDQVLMAAGHRVTSLAATLDSDGGLVRQLRVDGMSGPREPFNLRITTSGGRRTLEATASDAGELLAAFDIVSRIEGGKLTLNGSYDDTRIEHPLNGTAQIDDFRVRNAPVMARLLQGMTLYGLVEMLHGPGLGFTHLIAPFQLTDDALVLTDARAFSSSLGLTAKGSFDLDANTADIEGTIVPAYFFNSLLGNIPLVGRLFSPERGGGLFAASYSVRGSLEDPSVSINPLSALTPGFLRGLFGLC